MIQEIIQWNPLAPSQWTSTSTGKTEEMGQMSFSHLMLALKKVEREGPLDGRYACLLQEALSRGLVRQVVTTFI